MEIESAVKAVIIVFLVTGLYLIWTLEEYYREPTPIAQYAKLDLSKIGDTGYVFKTSLTNWLYSILVVCYRQNKELDVMPAIRDWITKSLDSSVEYDVEEPYTKFLSVIDEWRKSKNWDSDTVSQNPENDVNDKKPKFKVSPEYDYHQLPKVLVFNDYIDCESLMVIIDVTLGGTAHE